MSSNVVDKVLKRCRCVSEAERHYQRLKQPVPSTGAVSSAASEAVPISGSIAVSIVGMVGDKITFCVGYSGRCKKRRDRQEDLCATGRKA